MRVQYVPVSEKEWMIHLQKGGGFHGTPYQRGAGLGSIFRSIFRALLPVAKSAGKAVGKRLLQSGAELATDVLEGKPIAKAAKRRGRQAVGALMAEGAKKIIGPKRKGIKAKPKAVKSTDALGVYLK